MQVITMSYECCYMLASSVTCKPIVLIALSLSYNDLPQARGRGKPPAPSPASQRKQEPPSTEDEAKPSLKLKGVDSKLAHSILDEIVEE